MSTERPRDDVQAADPVPPPSGSRRANMKEMRFSAAGGEWRVAFAFDPARRAMLLVAGDKSGGSGRRFDRHLARLADG